MFISLFHIINLIFRERIECDGITFICIIHVAKHVSAMSTNFSVIHYRCKLLLPVYSVCNFFRLLSALNL